MAEDYRKLRDWILDNTGLEAQSMPIATRILWLIDRERWEAYGREHTLSTWEEATWRQLLSPTPEWGEPERPTPEWGEPERPQPKRGESVRPQPKREESVRPQPKREESGRPQPKEREVGASTALGPKPPAEGECLLVLPPPAEEQCLLSPSTPAEEQGLLSQCPPAEEACLLVHLLLPSQKTKEG
ncbi:UNVERIFIED_CONTAM: hypothetical protein FKN15_070397 [Acipenser sinensis]